MARPASRLPLAVLAVALLLSSPRGLALDPTRAITQYLYDVWKIKEGLPQNTVQAICQTRDGYLWLGTEEGLARFDGVRFTVFDKRNTPELRQNLILALYEDSSGYLWIGTNGGGLARYRAGRFVHFSKSDGLLEERVRAIHEDAGGVLWVGTEEAGLHVLRNGSFVPFRKKGVLTSERIRAIEDDGDGGVWVGTDGGGVLRIPKGKGPISTLRSRDGLPSEQIRSLTRDPAGVLWIGTYGGGLARLDSEGLQTFTTKDGLLSDQVAASSLDRDGNLWIGTTGGLNRYSNGRFSSFSPREGLSDSRVFAVFEDREGSVWLGTLAGGLGRLRAGKLLVYSTLEGLSDNRVRTIHQGPKGTIWIGTDGGGLNRFENGAVTPVPIDLPKRPGALAAPAARVWTVLEDRSGSLWVGLYGLGLGRLTNGTWTLFTTKDGLAGDRVAALYEDERGALWVGSHGGGLSRILPMHQGQGGVRIANFGPAEGLASDKIRAITGDGKGGLYVATDGAGLFQFRGEAFHAVTTKEGPSRERLWALTLDGKGSLWMGTYGAGLGLLRDGRVTTFSEKDGLFDDTAFQLLEDSEGYFWVSGNRGIYRVKKADLLDFADGLLGKLTTVAFGAADGMRSPECNGGTQPNALAAADGRLFFPTVEGVVVIDPTRLKGNPLPPPVVIENLTADQVPYPAASAKGDKTPLSLAAGRDKFEFHYTAPSLLIPERVRFRYRLLGYDRDWVLAGTRRTAYYTRIGHGSYTFEVTACNDEGVWNEVGAAMSFTIRPWFYETWLFRLASLAALSLAGYSAYRGRVRTLKRRQDELKRAVDARTKELTEKTLELSATNDRLGEAQSRIAHLMETSTEALLDVSRWSQTIAAELAGTLGVSEVGIFLREGDAMTPISASLTHTPVLETPPSGKSRVTSADGSETAFAVEGMSGEIFGAVVIPRLSGELGEAGRNLVLSFARQLGGVLELQRLRRELAASAERGRLARREMADRGFAFLQICPRCQACYGPEKDTCAVDGSILFLPRVMPYRVLDRYRLVRVIGEGGMATVFEAEDERLNRRVAIKVIRASRLDDVAFKLRLEQEAKMIARIDHPGVIKIYDTGEFEDGSTYLVMEFLDGRSLEDLAGRYGAGSPEQIETLLVQGSAALAAAHRLGLVHRDIKPGNIYLLNGPSGIEVKLLDFGLAKSLLASDGLTQAGMVVGTPAYMSPEQMRGVETDARSDIFSFAVVVYEALTAQRLVRSKGLADIFQEVIGTEPPRPSSVIPGIPVEVDEAFERALARDPDERPSAVDVWVQSFVAHMKDVPKVVRGWPVPIPRKDEPTATKAKSKDPTLAVGARTTPTMTTQTGVGVRAV